MLNKIIAWLNGSNKQNLNNICKCKRNSEGKRNSRVALNILLKTLLYIYNQIDQNGNPTNKKQYKTYKVLIDNATRMTQKSNKVSELSLSYIVHPDQSFDQRQAQLYLIITTLISKEWNMRYGK